MATYSENLIAARNQIAERIREVTEEKAPSYNVGGTSVSWESYLSTLVSQLDTLNQAIQRSVSPFQVISRARP